MKELVRLSTISLIVLKLLSLSYTTVYDSSSALMTLLNSWQPDMITTDKEPALEAGMKAAIGDCVEQRKSKYMNNRLEQDHRAPKSRYRPMKGFGDEFIAVVFLHSFEELRQHLRTKGATRGEKRRIIPSKINYLVRLAV